MWKGIGQALAGILTGILNWWNNLANVEKREEAESKAANAEDKLKSNNEALKEENKIKDAMEKAKEDEENKPIDPNDILNS